MAIEKGKSKGKLALGRISQANELLKNMETATIADLITRLVTLESSYEVITLLQDDISSISTSITAMQESITSITSNINGMNTSLSSNSTAIETLNTNLGQINTSITSINESLTAISGRVSTLENA